MPPPQAGFPPQTGFAPQPGFPPQGGFGGFPIPGFMYPQWLVFLYIYILKKRVYNVL